MTKEFSYSLPDKESDSSITRITNTNSVIIIGSNGSGKSKLGAWIEQSALYDTHRVGAQRSLNFSEHIPSKSFAEAEDNVLYGGPINQNGRDKNKRWGWGKKFTTQLLNDFDDVLAALIAQQNNEYQAYVEECKQAEANGLNKPHTPKSSLDKLFKVWRSVFPQRTLKMRDLAFLASVPGSDEWYSATEMSDGERSVLYLAAQVLCIPKGKTIIVDEPETHLHPSLMSRLWEALESERKDCLFIYITHDVDFAAQHELSDIIWVKSFNGKSWDWEFLPESALPEALLIELAGNRKPVLFVEGTKDSYDARLYSLIYPDCFIVPCGSCEQVIQNTKAYRATSVLSQVEAYGLIDRDFRSEEELEGLKEKGVSALGVAEVENLFLVEPVVRFAADRLMANGQEVFDSVRDYVINQRFKNQLDKQVNSATIAALKGKLSGLDIAASKSDLKKSYEDALGNVSFEIIYAEQRTRYDEAFQNNDYPEVLKVFNEKGLANSIGHFMGVDNKEYCGKVLRLLELEDHDKVLELLHEYIPAGFTF